MHKILLRSFLIVTMVLSSITFVASASASEPQKSEISSVKSELNKDQKAELKQFLKELESINGAISSQSAKESKFHSLAKTTDKTVLEAYNNQINQELQEAINSFEDVATELGPDTYSSTHELTLSDGSRVVYEIEDELLQTENTGFSALATSTISYGSRIYTASYSFYSVAYPDPVFKLITFYNASRTSGLTATSTSTAGTSTIFPYTITKNGNSITDARAATPGTDINSQADFTLGAIGINGIALLQLDISIVSTIKLNSLSSSTASITYSRAVYK